MADELPEQVRIKGRRYVLVALRVETTREDGSPDQVTIVRPDDVVELSGETAANRFVTAYIHESGLRPWPLTEVQ